MWKPINVISICLLGAVKHDASRAAGCERIGDSPKALADLTDIRRRKSGAS